MKISHIEAKSILNKSKLKNVDYTINPYIGCEFACKYCYASYLSNLVKENSNKWGEFLYIKKNTINLLEKELGKMILNNKKPKIMLSSATDPYQYFEFKEKITKKILETFVKYNFQGELLILTKSPLILRDINTLKKIKNLKIGLSICHNNNKIKSFFEPNTPSLESRFHTLEKLNKCEFKTCVFIAPILPYFENHINELDELFKKIKNSGTDFIVYDLLNLYGTMDRFSNCFNNSTKAQDLYLKRINNKEYKYKMNNIIKDLINKYDLKLMN